MIRGPYQKWILGALLFFMAAVMSLMIIDGYNYNYEEKMKQLQQPPRIERPKHRCKECKNKPCKVKECIAKVSER